MSEKVYNNRELSMMQGRSERVEVTAGMDGIELATTSIHDQLSALTDIDYDITVTSTETVVAELSVGRRTTLSVMLRNHGDTNALDFRLMRHADETDELKRVIVDWSELSPESDATPIDIVAYPGRYTLELRSTDGTTAKAAMLAGG